MTKHFYLSALLVACVARAAGAADVQTPVSPPPVACLGDGARAYLNELLGRIRDLEQRIERDQAARLAERADSARLLEQTRTDGAARLETFSGELRSREQALDAAKEEARRLHDSGAVCGSALEVATKEAGDVAAQRDTKAAELQEASRRIAETRGEIRDCTESAARQKREAQELTAKLRGELEASRTSAAAFAADLSKVQKELATNRNALATAETGRAKSIERAEAAERGLAEIAKQQESEQQRIADLESAVAQSRAETESVRADGKEKARLVAESQGREEKARTLAEASDSRAKELSEKVAGLEKSLAEEKLSRAGAEETAAGSDKRAAASQEDAKKTRAALAARENELGARIAALEKAGEEEAARRKVADEESAKKLAASEKTASSLRADLESQTKDVASLREQLKAAAGLRAAFEAEQQKSAASVAQLSALRDELAASKAALSDARAAEAKVVKQAQETAANAAAPARRDEESTQLEPRTQEIAVLEQQVEEAKRAEPVQPPSDESRHASGVQGDLERARAEIARLNNENLEQQALIDELKSTGKPAPVPRSPKPKSHREETARARKAPPIAQVSLKTGDRGAVEAGRSGTDPLAEQLAQVLTRREDLERTIEKLKGSPADRSAPGKAAELQAELAATNKEVLRLTVLMSERLPTAR